MACARCGCGVFKTEEFISLNKVWHKHCFTCFQCSKRLDKQTAKIFQGELFCDCCYSCVIEKLFEVISTPSLNRPCRVASSPSCASRTFEKRLEDCENLLRNFECPKKEYCFPAERKLNECKRSTQSCVCIPSQPGCAPKNEYCFLFPMPREVANYYNRSHMRNRACKDPATCRPPPQCPRCCRKAPCDGPPCRLQIRTLESPPRCGGCSPPPPADQCCCSKCGKPPPPPPPPPCCPQCQPGPQAACSCCPKRCQSPCRPRCRKRSPPCRPKCPPRPCCPPKAEEKCCCRKSKYCVCGAPQPCNCKMSQIRALCTACCVRCGQKVYAAEKILVSFGAYHTSCFSCYCCSKLLDVKNVFEGCGEIFCNHCYNHFFGVQYYGFGRVSC